MSRYVFRPLLLGAALCFSTNLALADAVEGYVPAREALPVAPILDGSAERGMVPAVAPEAVEAVADPAVAAAAPSKVPENLPAAGAIIGEGDARIRVTVRGQGDGRYDAPLAGQPVELSVIRPPHQVVETLVAVTGSDGVATFQATSGAGLQAFARYLLPEREVFAPTGIALTTAGEHSLAIQDTPVVRDTSVIFSPRLITIAELWEDYIVFTQVISLATDQPVIFEAEKGGRDAGYRIPLPKGAAGVRVVQPAEQAESVGDAVMFRGRILPAGEAGEAPTLIVRYSLRHNNAAKVAWTQEFPFDVENLSVVIPQTSQHAKHPRLNVDIQVPLCGDAGPVGGVMCFAEYSDSAEGVQMLQGSAVRLARGGRVPAGGRMEIVTTGWPADPHIARWAAGFAVLFAAFLAFLLVRRSKASSRAQADGLTRLNREKEAILHRVDQLEEQLADAAILEIDYEAERERIIGELALVERRIRSFENPAVHG